MRQELIGKVPFPILLLCIAHQRRVWASGGNQSDGIIPRGAVCAVVYPPPAYTGFDEFPFDCHSESGVGVYSVDEGDDFAKASFCRRLRSSPA